METKKVYLLFILIAVLVFIYTFIFVDETHVFVLNAGWETNIIEAKWLFYLVAFIGICLWGFYYFFAQNLFSESLIGLHIVLFFLLAVVLILWDNNSFSLKEAVDSNAYSSVREIKTHYHLNQDRSGLYRILFWIFLLCQPIGLVNLILGFLKPNTK